MTAFEFSLPTAVAGTLASSLLLSCTLFYLWRQDRNQRALFFWALAFATQSLRMLAQLGAALGEQSLLWLADISFALVIFLIWLGYCALRHVEYRATGVASALALTLVWLFWGVAHDHAFTVRTLPLYLLSGAIMVRAGWSLTRLESRFPGIGYRELGVLFMILGAHYWDYPFLRQIPALAPYGFALASLLMLGIGIGMLILTQRRQQLAAEELTRRVQREIEERLAAESLHRDIVSELDEGILLIESSGRVIAANQAAANNIGIPLQELLDFPIQSRDYELFDDTGKPIPLQRFPLYRALREGESVRGEVVGMRRDDGSRVWLSLNAHPRFSKGDNLPHAAILSATDVTARINAERLLIESSERFVAISESSGLGVVVTDEHGNFTYCNTRYLTQLGCTSEEVSSGQWINHLHPDDITSMRAHWRKAVATRTGFVAERRTVLSNGDVGWGRARVAPIRGAEGEFRGFVATVEDISALKGIENALRLSEAKFSGAFHASLDYITISDLDTGRIIEVNEAFQRMTGWTRDEAVGRTSIELHIWPSRESRQMAIDILRREGFLKEYPMQCQTRYGQVLECLLNASIISADGRHYLLGVLRDISEKKRAEDALRASEEMFAAVFRAAPLPLCVTAVFDGRFVDINGAWEETFGFSRQEVIGRTSLEFALWADPADRERLYRAVGDKRELDRYECRYRCKDGREIYCLSSGKVFNIAGSDCFIWSQVDITLRREAQQRVLDLNADLESRVQARTEELQRTHEELMRSEKLAALGALVAGIAHELNTPIGNAVTVASTLHEKTGDFLHEAREGTLRRSSLNAYLEAARTASDLLLRGLNQARNLVTSFKQVAVDQTSDQRRRFDLHEVVAEVLTTLSPTLRKTPYVVDLDIPEGIVLDSYPGPLGQVVTNFVTNALIHAFEGRTSGRLSLTARCLAADTVELVVADDGVGIPEEHLRRIFDPFFTTKLGRGGSGLGLNIVYNIVTRILGGRISVQGKPGCGTEFVLTMPLRAPANENGNGNTSSA